MQILIFTDLDGTLLGSEDYRYDAAFPAIAALKKRNIPLIPVTSKTRAEVEVLRQALTLKEPFITENGSGVFIPVGDRNFATQDDEPQKDYHCIGLGINYTEARAGLKALEIALEMPLEGFGDLNEAQIQKLTNLPLEDVKRAKARDFTEPFVTPKNIPAHIVRAKVRELGLEVVVGDRFSHLIGRTSGKGKAVQTLVKRYQRNYPQTEIVTVGLGNSPNDLPMLEGVNIPIILPGPKGIHPGLQGKNWQVAPSPAPEGWATVVQQLIK